ncbi:protein ABHD18 isoform X2 [Aethina tumida]|uniref:protein ABHD18 isoform X2 n=1 Tax=Aethina tumida TaxID=116153 RepID=UPI002148D421|nr:protein ABHD18 isoform X2 [Aethina tumida]
MHVSRLDVLYRKLLLTKFFTKGWGSPDNLIRLFEFRKIISNRDKCYQLVPKYYPITIINEQKRSDCRIIEGKFRSPFALHLPNIVSPEVHDAYFQMVLPLKWNNDNYKPMCIHLAGTGDHYFWRRRNIMAMPLLKKGIGAIILENPYYGLRKPKTQIRSSVHYVSDIFVMGGCLILECLVLLNWCESLGFGPLGVTGISMGGHGVMSESIDWDMLQDQYYSDAKYSKTLSKICKIVDDPFACSLMRSPELTANFEECKNSYVTPYEMMSIIKTGEMCSEVAYKPSLVAKVNPVKNLLKDTTFALSKRANDMKQRDKEALWFMRGMMDECTHLKNFSVPVDTSLIISICAQADGYVPRQGVSRLEDIWPGATVNYVESGHVGAYIWYRKLFRDSILEAFNRAKRKVDPPNPSLLEI